MILSGYLIVLLAFGLAMDAFAVSVTNGMCYRIPLAKNALSSGLAFGVAQGLMPLIGYYAGLSFSELIARVDHWLALGLLAFIGGRMLYGAYTDRKKPREEVVVKHFSLRMLFMQALATSIDALAVGVGLGVMQVNILAAVGIIGLVTFLCSFSGVLIGRRFGQFLQDKAEILGGAILICIGIRIFLEHMTQDYHWF